MVTDKNKRKGKNRTPREITLDELLTDYEESCAESEKQSVQNNLELVHEFSSKILKADTEMQNCLFSLDDSFIETVVSSLKNLNLANDEKYRLYQGADVLYSYYRNEVCYVMEDLDIPEYMTKPTPEAVRMYNDALAKDPRYRHYMKNEETLQFLLKRFPAKDMSSPTPEYLEEIVVKCSLLDTFYSTNIKNIYSVAEPISKITDLATRLSRGDTELVNIIRRSTTGIDRFSFATKYCHMHEPEKYPICDSFVIGMLYYFNKKNDKDYFPKKANSIYDYDVFKDTIDKFRDAFDLGEFSYEQIDKYLWLMGKEYNVKRSPVQMDYIKRNGF